MWDYHTWMKRAHGIATKASVKGLANSEYKVHFISNHHVSVCLFGLETDSHGLRPKHLPLSCASQKLPPPKGGWRLVA